ncbi:MAG: hypothetical protein KatS3mg105_2338 [Gemmatales bacterium]|nr:MAG: hypothetical protein KatS3mg105_2338 [Gemmatales bacterium]
MLPFFNYGLAWASFGLVHSLLVRPAIHRWLDQRLGCLHRLAYNLLALVHFAGVLAVGHWLFHPVQPFAWLGGWRFLMYAVSVAGTTLILMAVTQHGWGEFTGVRQIIERVSQRASPPVATLVTSGLYCWVRHPIYFGALLVFWGLAVNPLGFASAVLATIYILIGAFLEERDLVARFGDDYRRYQRSVPMLLPIRIRRQLQSADKIP